MAATFTLQLFTQEKKVFSGEVTSVIAPGEEGYFGVLAHHAPLVAVLGPGTLTVKAQAGADQVWQLGGGFLEVHDNLATVLADDLTAAA